MSKAEGAGKTLHFRVKRLRIRWEGSYVCNSSYRRNLREKRGGKLEETWVVCGRTLERMKNLEGG